VAGEVIDHEALAEGEAAFPTAVIPSRRLTLPVVT